MIGFGGGVVFACAASVGLVYFLLVCVGDR